MKITRKENFRIIVEPRRLGDFGFFKVSDSFGGVSQESIEKEYQQRCEEIEEQIQRHVDNVSYCNIEFDSVSTCSHCGYEWEESLDDDDPDCPKGMPLCCDTAQKEFALNQSKPKELK